MSRTKIFVMLASLMVAVPGGFALQPDASALASRFKGPYGTVQPSIFSILSEPVVRKELGVTDKQESQILDVLDQTSKLPLRGPGQKQQPEEHEANKKTAASLEEELKKLLTPRQLARVNQLEVQAWGAIVVMRPDIAKAVGLTEEQKQQIRQTRMPYPQAPRRQELQGLPLEQRQRAVDQWHAKVKEKEAAMLNVLSDEQKEKFSEFRGKDFAFPSPRAD